MFIDFIFIIYVFCVELEYFMGCVCALWKPSVFIKLRCRLFLFFILFMYVCL